jgi:antitoxin StbD
LCWNDREHLDLKQDPMATVAAGKGLPVAILDGEEPAFYCLPVKLWEELMERIEDAELNAVADAPVDQPVTTVRWEDL